MLNVGIIGAGALGTAIAQSISNKLDKVFLYARRSKIANDINNGCNEEYFPNIKLNDNIVGINDLNQLENADCIILTIPSSSLRNLMETLVKIIKPTCVIISTIKGIDKSSAKTASQIIKEISKNPLAVLAGPNIAREIVQNLPAATTIALNDFSHKQLITNVLESNEFKLQFNHDLLGTELCGIVKNILAISFGICEGLNINDSAKFAILNKGFVETKEIIEKLGGKSDTILNYCGFGDIVSASTLPVSRNHTLGVLYGQKIVIDEKATGVVFEGKNSIITIKRLCDENNLHSDIVDFVNNVIIENTNPEISFKELWENI